MQGTSARRELGFVLVVGGLGVALVLVVAFAPWYEAAAGSAGVRSDRVATEPAGSGAPMP